MSSETTAPLLLLVHMSLREDRREEAVRQLQAMGVQTKADEGCERLELVQVEDDPLRVIAIERWTSRELWEKHMQSPANAEGNRVLEPLLASPGELVFLTLV